MDWEGSAWPHGEVSLCDLWKSTATVTSLGDKTWDFASLLSLAQRLARSLRQLWAAETQACVAFGLDEGMGLVLLQVAVLEAGLSGLDA